MAGGQQSPDKSHPGAGRHESWGAYDRATAALMAGCPGAHTPQLMQLPLSSSLHLPAPTLFLRADTWHNELVRAGHRVNKGMTSLPPPSLLWASAVSPSLRFHDSIWQRDVYFRMLAGMVHRSRGRGCRREGGLTCQTHYEGTT